MSKGLPAAEYGNRARFATREWRCTNRRVGLWENQAATARDLVFQSRLCDSCTRHSRVQTERGSIFGGRQALLIQAVTCLVNGTEQRIKRLAFP